MEVSYVRTLYDYNTWAWSRLFAQVSGISQEDYSRANGFTYGSLRGILLHALDAEAVWLARWAGGPLPAEPNSADLPTIAELLARWGDQDAEMRSFLEKLTAEQLAAPVTYQSTRTGMTYSEPLWQLMLHVVNHATQHRSEAAEALTMMGRSPGDLDMLDYFREQSAAG